VLLEKLNKGDLCMITTKRSEEYLKGFISDYENYGKQYVMDKYNETKIACLLSTYRKKLITFSYITISKYLDLLSETDQIKIINEFEKYKSKISFCLKYKVKYPINIKIVENRKAKLGLSIDRKKSIRNKYIYKDFEFIYGYLLKYGTKLTIKKIMEKYSIKYSNASKLMLESKEVVTKKANERHKTNYTYEEKLNIVKEYNEYGGLYIQKKYGYKSMNSAAAVAHDIGKSLGIKCYHKMPKLLSVSHKMQVVNDYKNYGTQYVMDKYKYSSKGAVYNSVYWYRKTIKKENENNG